MKAVEFVRRFGWEVAKNDLALHEDNETRSILYVYGELKRLVESHEILRKFESISDAKEAINNAPDGANEFRKLSCSTRYIKIGPRFFEYWDGSKWCRPTTPFTEDNHILRFTPLARLEQAIIDVESVGGGV